MATINGTSLDDMINGLAVNDTLGAGRGGTVSEGAVRFSVEAKARAARLRKPTHKRLVRMNMNFQDQV